jgi:hypothetical protein
MRHVLLLAVFSLPLCGQKTDGDQPVMQQLLTEVQQLRLAIERSTLLGARTQLALSRLQMQEGAAAHLAETLANARREGISMAAKRNEITERVKELESRTPTPDMAVDLKMMIKQSKLELEQLDALEQERGARESDLANQFQQVQSQLAESRARISEMERSLDAAIQQLLKR